MATTEKVMFATGTAAASQPFRVLPAGTPARRPLGRPVCGEQCEGWACTEAPGHGGDHIAGALGAGLVAWPQDGGS